MGLRKYLPAGARRASGRSGTRRRTGSCSSSRARSRRRWARVARMKRETVEVPAGEESRCGNASTSRRSCCWWSRRLPSDPHDQQRQRERDREAEACAQPRIQQREGQPQPREDPFDGVDPARRTGRHAPLIDDEPDDPRDERRPTDASGRGAEHRAVPVPAVRADVVVGQNTALNGTKTDPIRNRKTS